MMGMHSRRDRGLLAGLLLADMVGLTSFAVGVVFALVATTA